MALALWLVRREPEGGDGKLLVPYLLGVSFALVLNGTIWRINS